MFNQTSPGLLVIDNYDSFTYNLVQMFMGYDLNIRVFRSDQIGLDEIAALAPDYILISPGPKDPAQAGISVSVIERFYRETPIFGVCLGLQCLNEAFGGKTSRAPVPVHGKVSRVHHENQFLFQGVSSPFIAARYHSLMADDLPSELLVTARSDDGVIMGLSHRTYPLHGVQFHPESFLTEEGFKIVENYLRLGPLERQLQAA